MKRNLQPVYVNPEPDEKSRYGEKEFLIRTPPEFEYAPVRTWQKWIKFLQIEKVR